MQDSWNRQVVGIILRQQRGERAASAPERAKRPAELDDHEKSEKRRWKTTIGYVLKDIIMSVRST